MNCQRFEDIVNDVAREQILDVSVRGEALAHSRECEHCALRLEDESAITLRLRSFAGSFESVGAPARVETQLLAAFGERPPVALHPAVMSRQQYWPKYWVAGIAALLLVVFTFVVFRSRQIAPAVGKTSAVSVARAGSPTTPEASPLVPATSRYDQSQPSVPRQRALTVRHDRRGATPTTNQANPKGPTDNSEIATDFMPVTYGGVANLADGGRMVRVELPRSAMASFGLPVNMDRANERVKADVLLGVDGLAHAIRFVR
ncbi:MAG TPA: hypothetical protein VII34_13090 [Pyrinomonadaceae bacterium]